MISKLRTYGTVLPSSSVESAPNASQHTATDPVEFDGIAIFLVTSLDAFKKMVQDPDEHNLIDKTGPSGGIMASFEGLLVSVIQNRKH